jgi:hypothetical protein
MHACETAKPRGKILLPLREAYPGCSDEDFMICSGIACNNGSCSPGDIVTFLQEGVQVGQVLVSVTVKTESGYIIETIIARWRLAEKMQAGAMWAKYTVSGDDVVKVPTQCIDTVLIWALAADKASCNIYLPAEIRPA